MMQIGLKTEKSVKKRATKKNLIRKDLAYAYRILGKLGLDDHTYTHLSARDGGGYYIYPFGYRFEEVTPDCLLTVGIDGTVKAGQEHQYNQTGYMIHGALYRHRNDIKSIFHLHTVATVAVSAMKCGLLPISQWALHFYDQVAYHEYNSLVLDEERGLDLLRDMGDKQVMFLRNHGMIACGKTIWEALFYCYHLELACKAQVAAMSSGAELILPSTEICERSNQDLLGFEEDLGYREWLAWKRWIGSIE